jgi:Calx-beta domain-containing protein
VLGKSGPASVPAPLQVPLPPGPPVVDVDMDNACHALLTRADGSVLGWGCDFFEQVGNGPGPGTGVTTPTLIEMPGRSSIGLSASGWNSLVLTRPVADPDWERPETWVETSVADTTVTETGGKFAISLSAALPHDVTVDWSLEAGTAGADDVTLGAGTATVPAGESGVDVTVPVLDDALDEDAETFTVRLRDASNGIQLKRSQATATIEDDDAAPTVSVQPASVAEGDTSLTDGKVKVRLSKPSGKPVSVAYSTADGSAKAPADYAAASGTLVFAPGEDEAIVHVAVRGDAAIEPDEALSVSVGDASATLTIEDDEPLALSVSSPKVDEGRPATFTVALDAAAPAPVSVDYEVAGVTASVPADVAAASGTLTFAPGETSKQVTTQVEQDAEAEGDEAFRLVLRNAASDRPVLRGEGTVATIVDDDEAETPPPADTTAPVTTASGSPSGWSRQNVTVNLAATDEGSGVKEIAYRIGTVTKTVAALSASIPVTAEGATTIAYRATDNAGNVEAEKTVVVQIDKTAPTVSCTAKPGTLWPADHKLVPITVTVKVQDARSGPAGFSLVSVTSNEPDDAPGNVDGATTGDIRDFVLGTADVAGQLRAERKDTGQGRVYTLKYVGRDAAGNERTCTTTVTVPRGCAGAHAARAIKEVKKARRKARRRR